MLKQKMDKFMKNVVSNDTIVYIYNQLLRRSHYLNPLPSTRFMHLIALALGVLVIISVLLRLIRVVQRTAKVLCVSNVPKPIPQLPSLPIIGILHHIIRNRNDLPPLFTKWAIEYKPAARVMMCGYDFVFLHDPSLIQKLLMSGDLGHVQKPELIYGVVFTDKLCDGMVASKPNIWKNHRNIVSRAFTYEALKSYFPIINQHAHKLIGNFKEQSTRKECSYMELINKTPFDIISNIVTGSDIMSDEECFTFYTAFHRCQEIVTHRLLHPWLLSNAIWNFHPLKNELNDCTSNIYKWIKTLLKRRREHFPVFSDIKESSFNSLMDIMMSSEMSDEEICNETASFLIAGHDTVSVSLNFLLINLAMHQDHQKACREEVDEMFDILSRNEESTASDITVESLSELRYLDRCIKESLRLYPTIPIISRELTSPLKLDTNLELQAGVNVVVSPWAIQRNPEYYPEPDKFDPERFLPENCKNRSNYAFIPFSTGNRNCIGWKMAMYEIKILAAYIIRHFEISTNNTKEDIKVQFNIALALKKKINLIIQRRQINT